MALGTELMLAMLVYSLPLLPIAFVMAIMAQAPRTLSI